MPNFLVSLPGESLSLQDFDESAMCRVDKSIDTCFKSRVGLPPDCPLRPELREDFEFVIASCHGPRARFSRNFRDAAARPHWDHETNCDLCNQKCPSHLYLLRCFDRETRPFRLHKAILYAGKECSRALLREKRSSPQSPCLNPVAFSTAKATHKHHILAASCCNCHLRKKSGLRMIPVYILW